MWIMDSKVIDIPNFGTIKLYTHIDKEKILWNHLSKRGTEWYFYTEIIKR